MLKNLLILALMLLCLVEASITASVRTESMDYSIENNLSKFGTAEDTTEGTTKTLETSQIEEESVDMSTKEGLTVFATKHDGTNHETTGDVSSLEKTTEKTLKTSQIKEENVEITTEEGLTGSQTMAESVEITTKANPTDETNQDLTTTVNVKITTEEGLTGSQTMAESVEITTKANPTDETNQDLTTTEDTPRTQKFTSNHFSTTTTVSSQTENHEGPDKFCMLKLNYFQTLLSQYQDKTRFLYKNLQKCNMKSNHYKSLSRYYESRWKRCQGKSKYLLSQLKQLISILKRK